MNDQSEFYKSRDKAVYETYLRILRDMHGRIDVWEAIKGVAESPQPRFWVPARTIYNILRRHVKKSPAQKVVSPRNSLTSDVLTTYYRIKDKRQYRGKSLYFIADFVTAEPTHGFYLSHRRLFDIIRRIRKEAFRKQVSNALSGLQSYERHTLLYGQNPNAK